MLNSYFAQSSLFTEITNQEASVISGGDSLIIVYDHQTQTASSVDPSQSKYFLGGLSYLQSKFTSRWGIF